jgi:N-acetylglucosamine-6-phosphate deacetylase
VDVGERSRTASGNLAGSLLTLETALRNVLSWTGLPLHVALAMTSLNQARELGLSASKGSLDVGKDADIILCSPTLQVVTTMVGGRIVYDARSESS